MSSAETDPARGVCAVVVAYTPDEGFVGRLSAVLRQVDEIVVVDNASRRPVAALSDELAAGSRFTVIENPQNRGVAAALNQGCAFARKRGYRWALTLDQDSTPEEGMVRALLGAADEVETAVVSPAVYDEAFPEREPTWVVRHPAIPFLFRRIPCTGPVLADVTLTITSGSLTNLRLWEALGGFREELFIDYVDTDYCLRARRAGYRVAVSCDARLRHRLGDRREYRPAGFKFRPWFHAPFRRYFQGRNRILLWRRYALRFPHWWTFDLCAGLLDLFRILLYEDRKGEKIRALLRGTWDGLRGTGAVPAAYDPQRSARGSGRPR